VFLASAVPGAGRALIDRELYLPRAWTDDRNRCRQAGIPDDRCFATKPELARQMINRVLGAGMPFGWVAADEVLVGCASSGVSASLAEAVSPGSGTDRPTSAGLCPLASR
jgi:SRSO17 transposase